MVYKKFYVSVIFRVVMLAINALVFFYYWKLPGLLHLKFALGAIFVFQVIWLIWFLNRINRKLSSFFDSIKSDDYTIVYADSNKKGEFSELNYQLDKLTHYFKQLKLENERRNLYFKAVIEHVATGILAFSPGGKIHFINTAALEMFGISFLKNLQSLEHIQSGLSFFFNELKPGVPNLLELKTDSEVLQLSARSTVYKTPDDEWVLVSLQNIRTELEQKETQTWQKMIRILTHEIMNSVSPITSLAASLSKIVSGKKPGEAQTSDKLMGKITKGLNVIKNRGEGLVDFVQKYRELTILPQPRLEEIRVSDLFKSIYLLFDDQLNRDKIKLEYVCEPESLELIADRKMVEQVLINLLKNAIWAVQESANKEIIISAEKPKEGGVRISVCDTGCGIDTENMDKIFIPFFTTHAEGSGIGLSLSRQIMMMHGGSIQLELNHTQGATFILRFAN
ncbi:MAG: PAS domain-containing protein [Bacteroidales bacterium]|nr:PAS domain-containing protein [Bacteroidales bacterium]